MYVIDQHGDFPIFQINSHIGFDGAEDGEGQGINGKDFSREFFETDSKSPKSITVYTNSMGGDVQESIDMFTAIARAKSRTKGVISGFAYSCAGWIPLACDIVEMTTGSDWMCHMPISSSEEFAKIVTDIVAETIADKSGRNGKPKKTKEEVIQMMMNETHFNADQMLEEGLIDRKVTPSGKLIKEEAINFNTNKLGLGSSEIKVFYKQKQTALNQFLKEKTNNMKKVIFRLNEVKAVNLVKLTDDAVESDICDNIARMENKISALNLEKEETEKELKAKNSETIDREKRLKEMESKAKDSEEIAAADRAAYNKMKAMCENMEAENKILSEKVKNFESEAKAKDAKIAAKNLVSEYVIAPAIKNKEEREKVISTWEEKATNDFEGTKLLLDSIAVKMKFPTPTADNTINLDVKKSGEDAIKKLDAQRAKNLAERRKLWKEPA